MRTPSECGGDNPYGPSAAIVIGKFAKIIELPAIL